MPLIGAVDIDGHSLGIHLDFHGITSLPALDNHHRAGTVFADPVGGASQEKAGDARMAMLPEDQEVHLFLLSVANNGVGSMAAENNRTQRNAPTARVLHGRLTNLAEVSLGAAS